MAPPTDRRTGNRRGAAHAAAAAIGAALADDRRERHDRRGFPRRRSDMRSIEHFAYAIGAGETRLEVIVDGADGMRLVGMFQCGCVAIEPVGAGAPALRLEACTSHALPVVANDRRRRD